MAVLFVSRKTSLYASFALWFSIFWVLFLLDALAFVRVDGRIVESPGLNLMEELKRLTSRSEEHFFLRLFNVTVFIPFGIGLSEFLSATKWVKSWRNMGYVSLAAFSLSMAIEILQWVLHIGIFELTDLFLNTAGSVFGAAIVLAFRAMVHRYT